MRYPGQPAPTIKEVAALCVASLIVIVGLQACSPPSNIGESPSGTEVYYWHDNEHGVSCWLYGGSGNSGKAISCLRP